MIKDTLIRPANPGDAEAIARIYLDTWRATYTGILPQNYLDGMRYTQTLRSVQRALFNPQNQYLVADRPGGAVGYIAGGMSRPLNPIYAGEIYELYLLPEFQRQGLGRELLSALAYRLEQRGFYSMMVWVLTGNPNRRFYEKTGALYVRSESIHFAGTRLKTAEYGWIDITLAMEG